MAVSHREALSPTGLTPWGVPISEQSCEEL